MGECESCTNTGGEEGNEQTDIVARSSRKFDLKPAEFYNDNSTKIVKR